jgi:divalent metal cation (Fe/Co/Zn/Cd) transporter
MTDREALVRRGLMLNYLTIGYNSLEAIVALVAGSLAGSVALVGFGVDSVIEVSASAAAQWRLRADVDVNRRQRIERITMRIIGWSFLALGAYVVIDSGNTLWRREHPERSAAGMVILTLSVIIMPVLARSKRRVARTLESRALEADAVQTSLCAYLSVIALVGVGLNAMLGWWWADPIAALVVAGVAVREGRAAWRGDPGCADGCC